MHDEMFSHFRVSSFQPLQRTYPLVPAPIQARDIPTIQQQYLEERHIQLYQPITTFTQPSVVTVLKNEPANFELNLKNGFNHFQSPVHQQMTQLDNGYSSQSHHSMNGNGLLGADISNNHNKMSAPLMNKATETPGVPVSVPTQQRKKERRKMRAISMESSGADSESAMDTGNIGNHQSSDGNHPGQVAAVSSTANFKSPMHNMSMNDDSTQDGEKQVRRVNGRGVEVLLLKFF